MTEVSVPGLGGHPGSMRGLRRWAPLSLTNTSGCAGRPTASPLQCSRSNAVDPMAALVESWPDAESSCPSCRSPRTGRVPPALPRRVPVEAFTVRARAARSHRHSWTLSSTMTDLSVDEQRRGCPCTVRPRRARNHQVASSPAAEGPRAPGRRPRRYDSRESLAGQADRVKDNGLGVRPDAARFPVRTRRTPGLIRSSRFSRSSASPSCQHEGEGPTSGLPARADVSLRGRRGWRQVAGKRGATQLPLPLACMEPAARQRCYRCAPGFAWSPETAMTDGRGSVCTRRGGACSSNAEARRTRHGRFGAVRL